MVDQKLSSLAITLVFHLTRAINDEIYVLRSADGMAVPKLRDDRKGFCKSERIFFYFPVRDVGRTYPFPNLESYWGGGGVLRENAAKRTADI
jgi:hypothetical protein